MLVELGNTGGADLDTGAHGRGGDTGTDVLTLRSGRLRTDDSVGQRQQVFGQLFDAEGNLADRAVDDVGSVETVFNLTGFQILNGLRNVRKSCSPLK